MIDHIPCNKESRVIVRIWTSQFNKQHPGENVGHVSIETVTPEGYMSLWPSQAGKASGAGFWKPIDPDFKGNFQEDFDAEGERDPEVTICLYNLDAENIKEKFETIKEGIEARQARGEKAGWVLIGGNKLINNNSGESCASLAWKLLKAGGIYDEISSSWSSKFSSVVTPDNLSKAVISAKKHELEHYPETVKFNFDGEMSVNTDKGRCLII